MRWQRQRGRSERRVMRHPPKTRDARIETETRARVWRGGMTHTGRPTLLSFERERERGRKDAERESALVVEFRLSEVRALRLIRDVIPRP